MDPRTDTFADPAKVRAIDFAGTYYRSRGPLNATPSPQGRPVIIQAGTSERGQDFAARHAEAIIVGRETPDEMKRFYDAFKARMRTHGRAPEDCKIFFLVKPIIGDTDEAAQQRADALYANAPVEAGLAALSTLLQIDLSTYALDQPLPAALQTRATQGIRSQLDKFYVSGRTPDPAGDRDPQGQSRLDAVHWDAPARRRQPGAHHRGGRRRWLRHPAGSLAGLRRPVRGAGRPSAPATRRRARGVHGDDAAGAPAGVLAASVKGEDMPATIPAIIELETRSAKEVVDITARVESLLDGAKGGSCLLYLRHTTAGLMVVTYETGVPDDIMDILQTMTPAIAYRHDSAAHVAAHFLSALVGPSVHVPVRDGRLALGEFQKIVLMEFEGPRRRQIEMRLLAEA